MNSIFEAKVIDFLRYWLHYDPYDCGTLLEHMRAVARTRGHQLDARFAASGLAAGPEARVAASIVDRALGGGGCETPDYAIRTHIERWLEQNPQKGLF